MTITSASFPTPHLALRSSDEDELRRVRRFADEQALAAGSVAPVLAEELCAAGSLPARRRAFTRAHETLTRWRGELAARTNQRLGTGLSFDASRFTTPMREGGPNYDRIGYLGRLREEPVWDPVTRTYRGGRDTPAHRIMLRYGEVATARFAEEAPDADTLWNPVTLPDGSRVTGNHIVRGDAARRVAARLVERLRRRGADVSRIEVGGAPMYVVTAQDEVRDRLFDTAMTVLAGAEHGDVRAWQTARYLLYQAPMTKKGSDAVTRTFLVTVGAVLLGRAPVLAQDVDLRCVVAGQQAATTMPCDPPAT